MTPQFKQLVLFYIVISILLYMMTLSIVEFPYLPMSERIEYLHLAHSVLLVLVPLLFIVSMIRMAK